MTFEENTLTLAELTSQAKELQERIDEVKAKVMNEMKSRSVTNYKTDTFSISLGTRRTYTYSPEVKKLEEVVKLKKVEEEERGLAEVKVSEYITVRI